MENFIVSARKYRPATFDEVIGQSHISDTLKNALVTDHLAHAFLFTGPRGVGKTTCARILAKVINCHNPADKHTPCNECPSCRSFNENASFNIIELDAASNNTVDHMRSLIEQVRFQPQGGKYKVFIIDEVHMLSSQAFNAFLKTLEEPPPHAKFILATTEKHKIIPTILSRCQVFDFKRIQNTDIVYNLESICRKEGIDFEHDALHIISEKADGAMRDALSIFDRVVSSVSGKITYHDVIRNLNILDYDYYFRMMDALLAEDLGGALLLFDEITRNGFEGQLFIIGFSEHLRQLLVAKDPKTHALLDTSERLKNQYLEQAAKAKLGLILNALNIANQCDISLPKAQNKQLHVEVALSKLVFLSRRMETPVLADVPKKKRDEELSFSAGGQNVKEKKTEVPSQLNKPEKSMETTSPAGAAAGTDSKPAKKTTRRISRLDKLKEEAKKEIDQSRENERDFSISDIETVVNQYVKNLSSPYVKNLLTAIKLELQGKIIRLFVPSQLTEDTIKEELALLEQIRNVTPENGFEIQIQVNPELFPEHKELKPNKILSNKEKFEMFHAKNALIEKFVERFDLKIDAD
jgi:DNA polymerase-3 subunit gamma/tau